MEGHQKTKNSNSKKQQQIVETATELFFRPGIKRVTVEEICRKANVSKMTFYKYFGNKAELVKYLIHVMLEEGHEYMDDVENRSIPFTEKLQTMLKYKLTMTKKMSAEFIEEVWATPFFREMQTDWLQRVMLFITNAQKRGEIRPEIHPEFILVMVNKLGELMDDAQLKGLYTDYVEFTLEIWNFFYYTYCIWKKSTLIFCNYLNFHFSILFDLNNITC